MDTAPHRVWQHAVLAWVFLVAWGSAHAVLPWRIGIGAVIESFGHIGGVVNLLLAYASSYAGPMAALAFGVFAPLAAAIDYLMRGRTSCLVNMLLGATLALPALIALLWWEGTSIVTLLLRGIDIRSLLPLPLAGMIVGLGLRRRKWVRPR